MPVQEIATPMQSVMNAESCKRRSAWDRTGWCGRVQRRQHL